MYLIFFFVLYYIKNIQESNANNNANSYAPKTRKKDIPTPPAESIAETVTVTETLKVAQWRRKRALGWATIYKVV